DDFVAGSGSAFASAVQEGPKAGGLALTITFGESLSGYVGTAAQSLSQTIDMGILGLLLSSKLCDGSGPVVPPEQIPKGVHVDSREPGAASGKHSDHGGTSAGSPVQLTAGDEQV